MAQLKDLLVTSVGRFLNKVYASEFVGKLTGNADTATKFNSISFIDGVSFDGSSDLTHYGVCNTPKNTAAKTVNIPGWTYTAGAVAIVKFEYGISKAHNATLSINGGTAYYISNNGIDYTTSMNYDASTGIILKLVYDGSMFIAPELYPDQAYAANMAACDEYGDNIADTYLSKTFSSNGYVGIDEVTSNLSEVYSATYTNSYAGMGEVVKDTADMYKSLYNGGQYGICSTASSTSAKTVTVSKFVLTAGNHVLVKFSNNNTATSMTLNVNGLGAKTVYVNGTSTIYANTFISGRIYDFVYDGTYYRLVNDNDDYVKTTSSSSSSSYYLTASSSSSTGRYNLYKSSKHYMNPSTGLLAMYIAQLQSGTYGENKTKTLTTTTGYKWYNIFNLETPTEYIYAPIPLIFTIQDSFGSAMATVEVYGQYYPQIIVHGTCNVDQYIDAFRIRSTSNCYYLDIQLNMSCQPGTMYLNISQRPANITYVDFTDVTSNSDTVITQVEVGTAGYITYGTQYTEDSSIHICPGIDVSKNSYQNMIPGITDEESLPRTRHTITCGIYPKTSTNTGYLFVGGGTSSSGSNIFRVSTTGKTYGTGTFATTGADYAEITEWEDGNVNNEDRCGLFVCMVGKKMRIAKSTDKIRKIGVVSADPAICGDNFDDHWHNKYMRDIYGRVITETIHHDAVIRHHDAIIEIDPDTGEEKIIKEEYDEVIREAFDTEEPILNPDFDPNKEYISRENRPEFDYFGMVGKLVVRDDGTCTVDGYCYPNDDGIATDAEDGFYVMERLDENHIRVLLLR